MLFTLQDSNQFRLIQDKLAGAGESSDAFMLQEILRRILYSHDQLVRESFEAGYFMAAREGDLNTLDVDAAYKLHLDNLSDEN